MEIKRFFLNKDCLIGDTIIMNGSEFYHMHKVLRYKIGYKLIVCFNDGFEYNCTIDNILNDQALLHVDSKIKIDEKKHHITLFAGILKNNKLDYSIQKCVELGVDKIIPFTSTNSDENKFNKERANTICLESAKQCGSVFLSEVDDLINFDSLLSYLNNFDSIIVAYEYEKHNKISQNYLNGNNIAIIIGPEGGFKEFEIEKLKCKGASVVTLGKRILRAETASVVLTTLVMNCIGDLDNE